MLKIFIFMLLCCIGCSKEDFEEIPLEDTVVAEVHEEEIKNSIYVFVCGAVNNPGVYEVSEGSRAFEVIEAAGGFTAEAADYVVNQAEVLKDETKLYIPTIEEVEEQSSSGSGKVNINFATKEELMTLPGVGEAKANQIIQYRNENGSFVRIEDIMLISGIKEGLFEKIKEYITI